MVMVVIMMMVVMMIVWPSKKTEKSTQQKYNNPGWINGPEGINGFTNQVQAYLCQQAHNYSCYTNGLQSVKFYRFHEVKWY
jgi:hypothetical protein